MMPSSVFLTLTLTPAHEAGVQANPGLQQGHWYQGWSHGSLRCVCWGSWSAHYLCLLIPPTRVTRRGVALTSAVLAGRTICICCQARVSRKIPHEVKRAYVIFVACWCDHFKDFEVIAPPRQQTNGSVSDHHSHRGKVEGMVCPPVSPQKASPLR